MKLKRLKMNIDPSSSPSFDISIFYKSAIVSQGKLPETEEKAIELLTKIEKVIRNGLSCTEKSENSSKDLSKPQIKEILQRKASEIKDAFQNNPEVTALADKVSSLGSTPFSSFSAGLQRKMFQDLSLTDLKNLAQTGTVGKQAAEQGIIGKARKELGMVGENLQAARDHLKVLRNFSLIKCYLPFNKPHLIHDPKYQSSILKNLSQDGLFQAFDCFRGSKKDNPDINRAFLFFFKVYSKRIFEHLDKLSPHNFTAAAEMASLLKNEKVSSFISAKRELALNLPPNDPINPIKVWILQYLEQFTFLIPTALQTNFTQEKQKTEFLLSLERGDMSVEEFSQHLYQEQSQKAFHPRQTYFAALVATCFCFPSPEKIKSLSNEELLGLASVFSKNDDPSNGNYAFTKPHTLPLATSLQKEVARRLGYEINGDSLTKEDLEILAKINKWVESPSNCLKILSFVPLSSLEFRRSLLKDENLSLREVSLFLEHFGDILFPDLQYFQFRDPDHLFFLLNFDSFIPVMPQKKEAKEVVKKLLVFKSLNDLSPSDLAQNLTPVASLSSVKGLQKRSTEIAFCKVLSKNFLNPEYNVQALSREEWLKALEISIRGQNAAAISLLLSVPKMSMKENEASFYFSLATHFLPEPAQKKALASLLQKISPLSLHQFFKETLSDNSLGAIAKIRPFLEALPDFNLLDKRGVSLANQIMKIYTSSPPLNEKAFDFLAFLVEKGDVSLLVDFIKEGYFEEVLSLLPKISPKKLEALGVDGTTAFQAVFKQIPSLKKDTRATAFMNALNLAGAILKSLSTAGLEKEEILFQASFKEPLGTAIHRESATLYLALLDLQ